MAGKGKFKLQRHQVEFNGKGVDMKTFAYDIIVYTAKIFGIEENCIVKWDGPENKYGCEDFCSVVSRSMIKKQTLQRVALYHLFEKRYIEHGFKSLENVKEVLRSIITMVNDQKIEVNLPVTQNPLSASNFKPQNIITSIVKVENCLTITSEFILFLYSKQSTNLYLKEAVKYLYDFHFYLLKDDFNKKKGLDQLYKNGHDPFFKSVDTLITTFIPEHCIPYEDSVKKNLLEMVRAFLPESKVDLRKIEKMIAQKNLEKKDSHKEMSSGLQLPPSKQTSDTNLPENTGLGIRPHEDLLQEVSNSDVSSFQNFTGDLPQESSKNHREPLRRKQKSKPSQYSNLEQGIGDLALESSRTKHLREEKCSISKVDDKFLHNFLGASRPELVKDYSVLPSKHSEIDLLENTGLGIRPHEDLLQDLGTCDGYNASSKNFPEAPTQESLKNRRGLPRPQIKPKNKSSSYSSVEKDRHLKLESSGTKHSRGEKPSIPIAVVSPVQNLLDASHPDPEEETRESSSQDNRPSNSNLNQSSATYDATPVWNQLGARPRDPPKNRRGSSE